MVVNKGKEQERKEKNEFIVRENIIVCHLHNNTLRFINPEKLVVETYQDNALKGFPHANEE